MPDQTPSMPPLPVVAWRDDGLTRSGSTAQAYRVVTDETKRDMPRAAAESFVDALVLLKDAQAVEDERVREALERAAKLCDAERAEFMEQAGLNNGRQSDMAFGSVNSAERLAGAIRALARPTLSLDPSKGAP